MKRGRKASLSSEQVADIRRRHASDGTSKRSLADEYYVSRATIKKVLERKVPYNYETTRG